jgi:hypothetical protein
MTRIVMSSRAAIQAFVLVLVSVLVVRPCQAQDPRSPATASECHAAIASVEQLAANAHMPDMSEEGQLWTATRCGGTGGAALAKLIPLARTSTDIASFMMAEVLATNLADSSIAHAALQLAADAGASTQATIFALRVLMRLESPSSSVDAAPSYSAVGTDCRMHRISASQPLPGAPLPSDFARRAGSLAKLMSVGAAQANVRAMASCAYRLFSALAN